MNVPLKVLTVFRNDTIAFSFSSSLQVMPKEVFLITKLLCPRSSRETQGSAVRAFHSHLGLKIDVRELEKVFRSMSANSKYKTA